MRYAIVQEGIVQAVIIWDGLTPYVPPEGTELVRTPPDLPVGTGWEFDHGTEIFSPPAEPVVPAQRIFGLREFGNRFLGPAALVAADLAVAPDVVYARVQFYSAEYVNLDDPQTAQLLDVLEQAGILPVGRAAEILNGIEFTA